ncbi:phage holin family protein [Luteimicrobium subarcticum]|uniref:Superfamily IV 4 TMS phage holin n=1 Tax=Luteimicrobium subarcticum TaxID=620910 RepID=A0A2M8WRU2_9MICO|nr:phage holin family protein [Luteimicrobium subarcticum]PJI93604.1 superfamily IV 4 TMS phage holin [Luteimicrobium subarcticum]
MVVFLIRTGIYLASAALGIWVASLLLDDMHLKAAGFIIAVVVYALAQWILTPFIMKMTRRYANAFIGGVGLVSAFVGLLLASLIGDGLTIDGVSTWILATLIVWLVTALATLVLPLIFLRNRVEDEPRRK